MKTARILRTAVICVLLVSLLTGLIGCTSVRKSALNPDSPVTIKVWNYYNGDQLEAFDKLVSEFNTGVGIEKGIIVETVSQGKIDILAEALIAAVNGEAGAQEVPALAAVYAETAYILNQKGVLASLDSYFTSDELSGFIPGFIEEGRFNTDNELLLFPILKSTELFTANETDWAVFTAATGVQISDVKTKEDLTAAAKKYYEWTDSLTPDIAEDGKALYGRDSVPNYVYIGTYQLGHGMFTVDNGKLTVDLDKDTFRKLWDNYYIPYINGYFGAYASFRSEDCKTGKILSLTSSSSSAGYLPTAVTLQDDSTHPIETYISKDLPFANSNGAIVQQGASYCVFKLGEAQQEASVEFLKWFSAPERNLDFAMMSGYLPVTNAANNAAAISAAYDGDISTEKGANVLNSLLITSDAFKTSESYAVKPFEGSKDVRTLLGNLFEQKAKTDRETVVSAIAAGKTRAEATAGFSSDAYFDAFFTDLCSQVNAIVK